MHQVGDQTKVIQYVVQTSN